MRQERKRKQEVKETNHKHEGVGRVQIVEIRRRWKGRCFVDKGGNESTVSVEGVKKDQVEE